MLTMQGQNLFGEMRVVNPVAGENWEIDHGPDGAMGLVINRPTRAALSEVFPELEGLKKRTDALFLGGPVRTDQMFMLIRSSGNPMQAVAA